MSRLDVLLSAADSVRRYSMLTDVMMGWCTVSHALMCGRGNGEECLYLSLLVGSDHARVGDDEKLAV